MKENNNLSRVARNSKKEKIDLKGGIAVGLLFLIVGLIIGMIQGVW